jgi:hypothetical protein
MSTRCESAVGNLAKLDVEDDLDALLTLLSAIVKQLMSSSALAFVLLLTTLPLASLVPQTFLRAVS